ncbi:MAG: hypothetical protein GY873_14615 [Bosea sp.]|uniref:hypothetical protein n=1 Tax=Bosea sp. (in: a-proteobacteria) TaxID=1871050 RepID=UPI00239B8583|nr:hypothetical protein [Bosea sp. (in: a-proteobacteria)]MCP4735414.1 hypothetical protein [Bosea sp. (in: a-proteobacteria)]
MQELVLKRKGAVRRQVAGDVQCRACRRILREALCVVGHALAASGFLDIEAARPKEGATVSEPAPQ